jgi:hypothetical protein
MFLWVTYLQLKELTLSRTLDEFSFELVACTDFRNGDFVEVGHAAVHDNLQGG